MLNSTHRPSPALIVSVIALVMALAGSAVALPGKNVVKKNDIAKNAVRSKAIAKNAVKSNDIRNNKVKGKDVDEASLGTVPAATNATNAQNAASLAGRTPFSAVVPEGEHDLATFGPFTLIGECIIDDGGTDEANLLLETSANNSAMDSNSGDEFSDFDTGDNPAFVLASDDVTTGDPEIEAEDEAQLVAQAPDGSSYGVDNELLAINLPGQEAQCHFAGIVNQLS